MQLGEMVGGYGDEEEVGREAGVQAHSDAAEGEGGLAMLVGYGQHSAGGAGEGGALRVVLPHDLAEYLLDDAHLGQGGP